MDLLSARGITKFYSETDTLANDRIDLGLAEGETLAVVGENGAGKSTLARILAGHIFADSGAVLVRGRKIEAGSVRAAEAAGIGFVPQQSLLAGELSVAENVVLGREPRWGGLLVSRRKAYVETAMLLERFGLTLDPDARVSELGAAERRQTEIARALARGGEILIMDEPTSILSEVESDRLFELLRRLTKAGKAVIVITHRLSEVMRIADKVIVLRGGSVVAEKRVADTQESELSALMARERMAATAEEKDGARRAIAEGEPVFSLRGLRLSPGAGPMSLELRAGEILAVGALAGNGLGRLEDYAAGLAEPRGGEALIQGRNLFRLGREELRSRLLAYAPSDRELRGLCLKATTRDNLLVLRRREFGFLDWISSSARNRAAREAAFARNLAADPRAPVSALSGGNRQRVLLARELDRPRPVVLLAEPFQGLDIAAQSETSALIRELAARGSAVLILTSNVEEMAGLADRAIALYRGEISYEGPCDSDRALRELKAAMIGVARGSAA
jgi:simple sugar transport system ATP-binding protein